MSKILEIAREALQQMPPQTRLRPEDEAVIARHKELLLSWTPELVQGFYDTLFAHTPTQSVFHEGERPAREKTLVDWWQKTVEGPVDEEYWAWQAYVGLIHVKRVVTNPMMMGQAFMIEDLVRTHLDDPEVAGAMRRLMATVAAIIAYGYEKAQLLSIEETTGISQELIKTNVRVGVEKLLED